jgi:hypothetical protein
MVAVPVSEHNEVKARKVNAEGARIEGEVAKVAARVEQFDIY